jgi:hypothetical protein
MSRAQSAALLALTGLDLQRSREAVPMRAMADVTTEGDWTQDRCAVEVLIKRIDHDDWTELRLFGAGRGDRAGRERSRFRAGSESPTRY